MIAFLQSHWPTIAATCATIALWCLSVYVSRRPDIRAGGLVELGANALLMVLPRLGWPGRLLAFAVRPLSTPDGYHVQLVRSAPRLRLATKEREPIPLGRFVPILALLLPSLAWAQSEPDGPPPPFDGMPPPSPGVHPLFPLAIAIGIALLALIGLLCARAIERRSGKLLVLLACLGASQAACVRTDAGGFDLVSEKTRQRLAAAADRVGSCLGPVVLQLGGEVALAAIGLAIDQRLGEPAAWRERVAPLVTRHRPEIVACLRPAPAPQVTITRAPPSITVEPAGATP